MRAHLLPLLLLPLAGCAEPSGAFLAANAASVTVFGHAIPDLVVSAFTGKDCSVVRLDQGKSYCRPVEPPPETPTLPSASCRMQEARTMALPMVCWVWPMHHTSVDGRFLAIISAT